MEGMMFNPQYTAVQKSNNIPLPSGHLNACPHSLMKMNLLERDNEGGSLTAACMLTTERKALTDT
ncbi:hypothetical protein EYF80_009728 [Liparis tanakae]|uniref:Uncharacterized protein n=1 Tax=Liparis tanakae TaxID=230148 RepID=A0A4Z2IQD6_9TELE|nr:hypothetical protein EYF80_009728 [Liparis tanakae]